MIHFLKEEPYGINQFLKRNGSEAIIIVSATLFITLDQYHPIQNEWLSTFLYYAVFPILVILIVMRKNPLDFGFVRSGYGYVLKIGQIISGVDDYNFFGRFFFEVG